MDSNHNTNPWKGLNFYKEGEILYGRNAEILSLSQYIFNNTQTVLYGRSGIGKSSILNAGIFPKARRAGMTPVNIRFKHGNTNDYLTQICDALAEVGLTPQPKLPAIVHDGKESLWEFMHRHVFVDAEGERKVPLLVFDQFEEIFTLQKREAVKREFFGELGNLLNDVKPQYVVEAENRSRMDTQSQKETKVVTTGAFKGLNLKLNVRHNNTGDGIPARYIENPEYHMVFALREDFLSSLELYVANIPVMKDNRFGLLPINEEQAEDIIRLPRPGLVDDNVTKLIIEEVTGRKDFTLDGIPEIEVDAAVLSLYLSRLYIKKPENEPRITADLVSTHSGHIIRDFYIESVTSDPERNEILRTSTIETLEDRLLTKEGRRDNVSLGSLTGEGITEEELDILIERRKLLRKFNHGNDIRVEYIHDILCPVVKERKEQRELLRKQAEERQRQEAEKQRIIDEATAHTKRIKRRNKRILAWTFTILAAVLCVGSAYGYYTYYNNIKEHAEYYADFTLADGWPVGKGEKLTKAARKTTPLYYKLSKDGASSPNFTRVRVLSSLDTLPNTPKFELFGIHRAYPGDTVAMSFESDLSKVVSLKFTRNEDNGVEHIVASDGNDRPVFLMSFFHVQSAPNEISWVNFLRPDGRQKMLSQNGVDRIYLVFDSLKRIDSYMYYDTQRIRTDLHGIYGHKLVYEDNDSMKSEVNILIDQFATPLAVTGANAIVTSYNGESKTTEYRNYTAGGNFSSHTTATGREGVWKKEETPERITYYPDPADQAKTITATVNRDKYGRVTSTEINGNAAPAGVPPIHRITYSARGNDLAEESKFQHDGKTPWRSASDSISYASYVYDQNGNCIHRELRTPQRIIYRHSVTKGNGVTITEDLNLLADEIIPYGMTVDSVSGNKRYISYYGTDRTPVNRQHAFLEDNFQSVHMTETVKDNNRVTTKYYYVSDNGDIMQSSYNESDGYVLSTACKMEEFDDMGNRTKMQLADNDGRIRKSMIYEYQDGHLASRSAMGVDGTPVRAPEWEFEGLGYYKFLLALNEQGKLIGVRPVNEFDEESTMFDPYSSNGYLKWEYKKLKLKKEMEMDINGTSTIVARASDSPEYVYYFSDDKITKDYLVPYVHILDKESPLYKAGLRDGDRIIGIDTWTYTPPLSGFDSAWLNVGHPGRHKIHVVRPENGQFVGREFDISNAGGNPDLLANVYKYYLTGNEISRFKKAIEQ